MAGPLAPQSRRPLPPAMLKSAIGASKPVTLSETPQPASGRPGSRIQAPVSSIAANVRAISWSPLGNLIAVADARSLRVWNPEKPDVKFSTALRPSPSTEASAGSKPAPAPQNLAGTERLIWNPTRESELVSAGADGIVRFWDVRNRGTCIGQVTIGGEGFSMAWRPGADELVVGRRVSWDNCIAEIQDDILLTIDRRTLTQTGSYKQSVQTNQIAFSNGGNELFLTTGESQVKILDYPSMETLHTITPHTSSCYCVAVCSRGRNLAIGGSDALVTLWDLESMTCRHAAANMTSGPVRTVGFSFDGAYVAGGSEEKNEANGAGNEAGINVVHVESGEVCLTIPTVAPTPCVEWHPSRYWLAYGGEAGGVKLVGAGSGASGLL